MAEPTTLSTPPTTTTLNQSETREPWAFATESYKQEPDVPNFFQAILIIFKRWDGGAEASTGAVPTMSGGALCFCV